MSEIKMMKKIKTYIVVRTNMTVRFTVMIACMELILLKLISILTYIYSIPQKNMA
jgi:hypothetical protein